MAQTLTPELLAQALRLRQEEADAAKQTVEQLKEQRDIQREIASAAKATNIPYDHITRNIGNSLKELHLFENLEQKLNIRVQERKTFENDLIDKLKTHSLNTKALEIANSDVASAKERQLKIEQDIINAIANGQTDIQTILESKLAEEKIYTDELEKQQNLALTAHGLSLDEINAAKIRIKNEQRYIDQLKTQNKLASIGKDLLGEMGDLGKHISEMRFPDFTDVLQKGVKNFLDYDKAAFSLRKNMGFLRGDFDVLQNNVKTVGIELQDLGVSFEQVAASATAIASEFNTFTATNKDLVKDVSVLSAQLGIAESDSVKFLKTMSSIGNTTVASQKGMMGFAKAMANAAGVPLPAVMKDVAEASDDVRIFTGRSVDNLVKGAIQARQMGTTLQNMANSAKKMLDFQTSIADEMEASVLLGRDVNFQQARNLAYRKDIVGANQEILNIAKKIDFDAMDPYQAEAFAKASGKSVQELQEMLQADKEIEAVRNGTNEVAKAQLKKMEEMKRMRLDEAKDLGKMGEQRLREQANQERINALQNKFNQMMSELAGPVMDVVEPLLNIAVKILPSILAVTKVITGVFAALGTGTFIASLGGIFSTLGSIGLVIAEFIPALGFVSELFVGIGGILTTIGSSIIWPIVGAVLAIGGAVYEIYNKWEDITSAFKSNGWWSAILVGINAIGNGIIKGLLSPFTFVFDWIDKHFMGHSPSEIGLGILEGIKSVGGMLLDALTLPFRTAFNFVSGLFGGPKLPKMSEVVFGGKEETTGGTAAKGSDLGTIIAEGNKQVVAKLDELITLMSTGGIAVNIDGSKASMLLARAQKERGAFGAI